MKVYRVRQRIVQDVIYTDVLAKSPEHALKLVNNGQVTVAYEVNGEVLEEKAEELTP